jgi:hypothetical protein
MKMNGRLFHGPTVLRDVTAEVPDGIGGYQDRLEQLLVDVCRELSVAVPMWLTKNTKEYVRFRRTSFGSDQFFEQVHFDRMEIRVEE